MQNITYPQFRKYPHNKTYFKIISPEKWEELHITGNKCIVHSFVAKILPDRNYVYDLTFDYERHWLKIEEEEYGKIRRLAK